MSDTTVERERIRQHALAYPFAPPGFSFRMHTEAVEAEEIRISNFAVTEFGDGVSPLVDLQVIAVNSKTQHNYSRRVPVIAAGSNASFQRLKSKFTEVGLDSDFPVLLVQIADLVPVYSAHISKYGSIPGTLTCDPGAASLLHIAFLDSTSLTRVNQSEGLGFNYALALLEKLEIQFGDGHILRSACAYISRRGVFAPDGMPVRIDAFSVEKSVLPIASQHQILGQLHRLKKHDGPFDDFIHQHVDREELRAASLEAMKQMSQPCSIANMRWIEGEITGQLATLPDSFGD